MEMGQTMLSDQAFWTISFIICLIETAAICFTWDKKMKQMEKRERKAEERRKQRSHDDYCTREVERLYREGAYKEG